MGAADILKEHGSWLTYSEIIALAGKILDVGPKQAYRKVKKDVDDKKIRKVTLPDGKKLYGLPGWPLKWGSDNEEKQPKTQLPKYDLNPAEKVWTTYFKTMIPPHRGGRAARRFAEEYQRLSRKDRVELLHKKSKE